MEEKAELDPTKVTDACISLCDILNGEALKRLHAEETEEAMTMLKKAELLAANTNALNGLCVCVCVLVWICVDFEWCVCVTGLRHLSECVVTVRVLASRRLTRKSATFR